MSLVKATGLRDIRRINELKEDENIVWSLWGYPIVYISLTMTLAIARMAQLAHLHWSQVVYFIGQILWACEGWCNVLLYSTREGVIPWTWDGLIKGIIIFMQSYHPAFWEPGSSRPRNARATVGRLEEYQLDVIGRSRRSSFSTVLLRLIEEYNDEA